jgi:transposase
VRQIPGIGPLVATAVVAAIGNGAAFRKGREFASWIGLVPRQYSTGGKPKLLGISKRGNPYQAAATVTKAYLDCYFKNPAACSLARASPKSPRHE